MICQCPVGYSPDCPVHFDPTKTIYPSDMVDRPSPPAEPKCECGHEAGQHTPNFGCAVILRKPPCPCTGYRPPTTEPASEGKWKPTEEMIARDIAFHGECFAVDYGNAHDYDDAFAKKMREREKWYKAGWQGRKRYEAEQGESDEQD